MSTQIGCSRVAEATLETPGTVLSVEGLDLAAEGPYKMIVTLVNPTDGPCHYALYFNGDREDTHYWRQYLAAEGETIWQGRDNDPLLIEVNPGESALVEAVLARGPDGVVRCTVTANYRAPDAIRLFTMVMAWTVPENVTSIAVEASVEDGMGPGSALVVHDTGAMVD